MRRPLRICLAALATTALAAATPALGLDYRSVSEAAVMYDAPSAKAKPLFIAARYTPVEVVVALDGWLKVRDATGTPLLWVERRLLAEQRTVVVTAARAQIRAQADEASAVVFEAEKDVVMELVEPAPAGWAKVRHRDGQGGYVRTAQVWGL